MYNHNGVITAGSDVFNQFVTILPEGEIVPVAGVAINGNVSLLQLAWLIQVY